MIIVCARAKARAYVRLRTPVRRRARQRVRVRRVMGATPLVGGSSAPRSIAGTSRSSSGPSGAPVSDHADRVKERAGPSGPSSRALAERPRGTDPCRPAAATMARSSANARATARAPSPSNSARTSGLAAAAGASNWNTSRKRSGTWSSRSIDSGGDRQNGSPDIATASGRRIRDEADITQIRNRERCQTRRPAPPSDNGDWPTRASLRRTRRRCG